MTQASPSAFLVSLFLADPDCYNNRVLALLRRLRHQLPTEEFQVVVQLAQDQLQDVDDDLSRQFFQLLLENNIGECLSGLRQLDSLKAAYYLEKLGIKSYPRQADGQPDHGMDFWEWFEVLPKKIQQLIWDIAGNSPYGESNGGFGDGAKF